MNKGVVVDVEGLVSLRVKMLLERIWDKINGLR